MNDDFQKAYNIADIILTGNKSVSDSDVVSAVDMSLRVFPNVDRELLKNTLLANHATKVDNYKILEGRERRLPWLKDFKANQESTWDFWNRYKRYLKEIKMMPDSVISQLDKLTDDVMDHLFNPRIVNIQIDKKGLVVGQVQSGKTANYTGLICKAADAGYNWHTQ